MATWPATLPAPQKQLSFSPGSNLVRRKLQSGRVEVRRFGSGAPGRIEAVFRLKADQLGAFEYFYERNLCLGVNWFTASWLNTGDKARFLGHPRTLGRQGEYFDIAATLLLVDELDYTPEDVLWPTGGTGGGVTPEPVREGRVKLWAASNFYYPTLISDTPSDLIARKVVVGGDWAAALKSDGTLYCWGPGLNQIPGWESLGGIKDIEAVSNGLYYITTSGGLGYITSQTPATNNMFYYTPAATNIVSFAKKSAGGYSWLCVVDGNGIWRGWGSSAANTTALNNGCSLIAGAISQISSGYIGFIFFDSNSLIKLARAETTDLNKAAGSYIPSTPQQLATWCRYYGVAYNNGTWTYWGNHANTGGVQTARPGGLVPIEIYSWHSGMGALHTDGTFLTWGNVVVPNTPDSSFKFQQVTFSAPDASDSRSRLAAGILKS